MRNNLLLILIGLSLYACHTDLSNENTLLHTFPFTLTAHNNISIKAVINKKDSLNLMFHTAANSLDLTQRATQKINSITWDNESEVNTWGGKATTRISKNNSLDIHNLAFDSLTIWENQNSGPNTDGKFGPNLFAGKVLEINFDEHLITLHKSTPGHSKEYEKLPLFFENDMMFIECTSTIEGVNYKNKFLIHSGYGGTALFDDNFVTTNKIGDRIKITSQQELKDSHGNSLLTKKGTIPLFTIGEFHFSDMPVGFFEGAIGRQRMSVIGGDILKRFNIIIDSKKEVIYMKPNKYSATPFN